MNQSSWKSARGFIDVIGLLPRAARVASAVENGRKPNRRDLEALGIDDIFPAA